MSAAASPSPAGVEGITLGAVVTTYESWPLAMRCLAALGSWHRRLERVVVVDDHSSCPPPELPADPRLSVRTNPVRSGFAATLNRAIGEVGTTVAVVFDADAYPMADVSQAICSAFASEPRLGLLGMRTVDSKGADSPSWSGEPDPWSLAVGQRFHGWLRRLQPTPQSGPVCLHAAAFAVRREAFLELGGADEWLGFLDVDIDLSMRFRRAEWIVRWEPSLVAFHEGGGSPVSTRWRVLEYHRSRLRLLLKHGRVRSPRLLRAVLVTRIGIELALLAVFGRALILDTDRRRDKIRGRRELLDLVRRELR